MALEAIFARDDIREMAGVPPGTGKMVGQAIWAQDAKLGPLLEQLPASNAQAEARRAASASANQGNTTGQH